MLSPIAKELLDALESVVHDGDMFENNPEEGTICFLCGQQYNTWDMTCVHDRLCPIHKVRDAIEHAREVDNE